MCASVSKSRGLRLRMASGRKSLKISKLRIWLKGLTRRAAGKQSRRCKSATGHIEPLKKRYFRCVCFIGRERGADRIVTCCACLAVDFPDLRSPNLAGRPISDENPGNAAHPRSAQGKNNRLVVRFHSPGVTAATIDCTLILWKSSPRIGVITKISREPL